MSVTVLAVTWGAGGLVLATLLPRLQRRRLAAVLPLAAAIVAFVSLGGNSADLSASADTGGLVLGRPAAGLALVCALAMTVTLLLAPPPDSGDLLVIGICGALATVALGTGSPLVWATSFLAGAALVGVQWLTASPSRVTLAAARVATLGAAALLAAAIFLPVGTTAVAPRAHLAAGLLAGGVAGGFALVPLGGWVARGSGSLRGPSLAPWALLLMPALLLTTQSLQAILPAASRTVFGGLMLATGMASAAWAAINGLLAADAERYVRVLLADLGLVGIGLASDQNATRLGSLLLLLTHLCVAPLLLQEPSAALARPRRLAWLALSGIPPTPAFWARFAVVIGVVAGLGGAPLMVIIPVGGALLAICVRAIAAAPDAARPAATLRVVRLAAWVPPLAALAVGLAPAGSVRALLGVG